MDRKLIRAREPARGIVSVPASNDDGEIPHVPERGEAEVELQALEEREGADGARKLRDVPEGRAVEGVAEVQAEVREALTGNDCYRLRSLV